MQYSSEFLVPTRSQKCASLLIPCLANLAIMVQPFTFGAIINKTAVDSGQATFATTIEIAMVAVASLLVSMFLDKLTPKHFAVLGVLMMSFGQFVTINLSSFEAILFVRAIAGVGEGLCLGIGLATLARMEGGKKLLGYSMGVVCALSLVAFSGVPMVKPFFGANSVFWVLFLLSIICIPLAIIMPANRISRDVGARHSGSIFNIKTISLFVVGMLASAGSNTLWLYFERVGENLGASHVEIGSLGSMSLIAALFVPFVANATFSRFKTSIPIIVGLVLSAVFGYAFAVSTNVAAYSIAVVLMCFAYIYILCMLRMYSAHVDHTGRSTAAVSSSDAAGLIFGPLLAAFILNLDTGFTELGVYGLAIQLAAIMPCILLLVRLGRSPSADSKAPAQSVL